MSGVLHRWLINLRKFGKFEELKKKLPVKGEFISGFEGSVSGVPHVSVVYGAPGAGKTSKLVDMIKTKVVPKPVLVLAFNNSTAHWFSNKVRGVDCVSVRTMDSVAVSFVGFPNMLSRGRNIEAGVEYLRSVASEAFDVPYSHDPYELAPGNEIFGLFDYAVNKTGKDGINLLIKLLNELIPGLGGVIESYVTCLSGKGRFVDKKAQEEIKCEAKYDFTLARLELLGSLLPHAKVGREDCGLPRTLIVDEFQDMSPLMLGILGKWLARGDVEHFVVAGDFDQLIYRSLHHADLEVPRWLYNQAKSRHGWQVIELNYSHRVAKPLDALAIEFLNAHDDEPSPWRRWSGNKEKFGVLYVKPVEDALREIRRDFESREDLRMGRVSYGVLTPTNEVVLTLSTELMKKGVLPHFLKGYPFKVKKVIDITKAILSSNPGKIAITNLDIDEDDEDLVDAINGVIRYARLRAKDYAKGTITTHLEGKESASIEEALKRVIEDELDVKYLTYARNPRAPVFIDTVYTAKGLEFDKVYIANYARKGSKVPRNKWGARLFYVALTRSKGSVVIMTSNNKDDVEWFSKDELVELAKKVGVEVIVG
jgi:hypothetical protein